MCELLAAVRDGNGEKTSELLSLDYFYNLPSWNQGQGIVLLREALAWGHCDIAKLLLSKGARVNNKFGNPTNDPLHLAVSLPSSIEMVSLLLAKGAKVNSTNGDGFTPLHLAVFTNNHAAVRILFDYKAEPNAEDLFRNTPLHVAAERNFYCMAELLLVHGAKPDAPLMNGFTPLHLACLRANVRVVSVLINHGADVNAPSEQGTPLDLAITDREMGLVEHQIPVVTALLRAGAKANALNNEGKNILHQAIEQGKIQFVSVAVQYTNPNALAMDVNGKNLLSPIQMAASSGHSDIADILIAYGADINMPCNTDIGGNCTSLHLAACHGHIKIVENLLKRGADVEVRSLEGKTPLFIAISSFKGGDLNNLSRIVRLLFDSGAKFDTVDQEKATILHAAVEKQSLPLVKLVLELIDETSIDLGSFLNSFTISGLTPLHIAASKGSIDIAEFLLERGAQINLVLKTPTSEGYTALHLASKYTRVDVINLFLEKGADVNFLSSLNQTPAHVLLSCPDSLLRENLQNAISTVDILLENGTDLNWADKNGDTLLNLGVRLRSLPVVETILKYKPASSDANNRNALRTAIVTGTKFSDDVFSDFSYNLRYEAVEVNRSIIEALQNYGLILNDVDIKDANVLHHAIQKGYCNIVQYLLNHGADHMAVSDLGSPLHSAVYMLQAEIVQILVSVGANVNAINKDEKSPISLIIDKLENLKIFRDFGDTQQCLDIAKILLSNGADLSNDSKFLIVAIQKKSQELVNMALKCRANVKVVGQGGSTVLHAAVQVGDDELVKTLLEHGAVVDATDEERKTPLIVAISEQEKAITHRLLAVGARVNVSDHRGFTPLHYAAIWGFMGVIEKLLQLGADVNAKSGAQVTPLHLAADGGRAKAVTALLRAGADPNSKRSDNSTALHLATRWNDATIIEELLYYGADITARTTSHTTPLGSSLKFCNPQVVRALLDNGGYTPDMCCSIGPTMLWPTHGNRSSFGEFKEILTIFLLDMEARQLWPDAMSCFCRAILLSDYYKGNDPSEELQLLKTTPVVENLFYFDIISKNKSQLVNLTRNEGITQVMTQLNLFERFPIFGKLIKYKWEAAVAKEKLLSSGMAAFNSLLAEAIISSTSSGPPLEMLMKSTYCWIFQFLKIADLDETDFAQYLRSIQSLLPAALIEKIIGHLTDSELKDLILAAPSVVVSP